MIEKPSNDTIKILKGISKSLDIEMSTIKERFTKLINSRAIQNLKVADPIDRERHSVRILVAEFTAERDRKEFSGNSVPVILRVESKEAISDFKRQGSNEPGYRAGMYITIQDQDENVGIAKLTLWNDACECHPNLIIGETYATEIVIGSRGSIWECSMNDPQDIEDSDVEIKPLSKLITENFTPITIGDIENNISKDRNDSKLVEGVVVSGWSKVTANDRDMGFLKIMGDIVDPDDSIVAKFSGDANCVNLVGAGDLIYVLGQTTAATVDASGEPEWPQGMWGELIIPIVTIDRSDDDEDDEDDHDSDTNNDSTDTDNDDSTEEIEEKIADW